MSHENVLSRSTLCKYLLFLDEKGTFFLFFFLKYIRVYLLKQRYAFTSYFYIIVDKSGKILRNMHYISQFLTNLEYTDNIITIEKLESYFVLSRNYIETTHKEGLYIFTK